LSGLGAEPVVAGERLVLALWFTCSAAHRYDKEDNDGKDIGRGGGGSSGPTRKPPGGSYVPSDLPPNAF
jgi:hypothetical protein